MQARKKNNSYVVLIGGANLDILGFPDKALIPRDSNPGTIRFSAGGVSRNIAENLSLLGVHTELITATGNGFDGQFIRKHCKAAGISLKHALNLEEDISSTYIAIMDSDGDMNLALSDMSASNYITADYLREKAELISEADILVADANLSIETLEYLSSAFPDSTLIIDPVSVTKSGKIRQLRGSLHTLKMNRLEAESISGIQCNTPEGIKKAGEALLARGIQRIIISSGSEEIYWAAGEGDGFFKPPSVPVINATGAGDAFTAGVVFSTLAEYSIEKTLKFSSAMAALTIADEDTVSSRINLERVRELTE